MRIFTLLLMFLFACNPPAGVSFTGEAKPTMTKQTDNASKVFEAQADIMDKMWQKYPSVDAYVRWAPCGRLNSFYYPAEKTVVLCTEFSAYPKVAVFVAAHEMAHAIAIQLLHVRDEESADEIAALEMLDAGLGDELLEAALYFKLDGTNKPPSSGHPSDVFRAWNLACLAAGYDGHPANCVFLYKGTKARWDARLGQFQVN